ncbi:MAG: outer membrane protein assembly factor, partial [Candidatus Omnitrophica bacterium]|nr:outer membrane protein assembly factor [Candidatus Omnitrophota bacterium]
DLKSEEGENIISSTSYELTYDSRDNILDPSKGKVYSGSVEIAGGPFGGDKDFWRFFGMTSYYFPVWRKSVVEAKGRIGLADSYGDSSRVPIYERYFAGGANTVRGYRERKIGPIDSRTNDPMGGDSMLIGNLEYNYPLANFFKLAAFYDVGNVWSEINDLGLSGLKSGVGFGFRLKTPIGPLKLDYGIPLNKESGEDSKGDGRFHFSMSHGF